ncbi:MAG: TonB family protein [Alphaproteobacteria bacterium]|nr:TonB family protein [Alphaproteobacteria bacterium]
MLGSINWTRYLIGIRFADGGMTMRRLALAIVACLWAVSSSVRAEAPAVPPQGSAEPARACTAPGIAEPVPRGPHGISEGDYPAISKILGEQGNVVVSFLIREDGTVADPKIVQSSGSSRLDDATLVLVMRWRYRPATQRGTPISCRHRAQVMWELSADMNDIVGDPQYLPPELLEKSALGQTMFSVSMDENGKVLSISLVMSSGDQALDAAGARFLKDRKFTPAQIDGKPMEATILVNVHWPAPKAK